MLKKVIDKVSNLGYNIRTGVEVSNREEYSFNHYLTKQVFNNIEMLDTALTEVLAGTNISHLIAGGCVRDALLGLYPKDYDIFLDLSQVIKVLDDDELDDLVSLTNYNIHRRIRIPTEWWEIPRAVHVEAYKRLPDCFLVYEHAFNGVNGADINAVHEDVYQLIYRKNNPDIATDPVSFVNNNFDWGLTKAVLRDGKVIVGQDFVEVMKTKEIKTEDLDTSRRIRNWLNRNELKNFNVSLAAEPTVARDNSSALGALRKYNQWRQRPDGVWEQFNNENQIQIAPPLPQM